MTHSSSSVCAISLLQSQVAEKGRELKELKDTLALELKEKEKLQEVGDNLSFFYRLLPLLKLNEKCRSFAIFLSLSGLLLIFL